MTDKVWVDVFSCDEIGEDFPEEVTINGAYLALYKCADKFFATDGYCSHEEAKLCDGYLDGGVIECPLHHARFDIRTGRALSEPATVDLTTYPVEIREGRVFVEIERERMTRTT